MKKVKEEKITKIAVFVSGGGTNLQAIIDQIRTKKLENIVIARVIASKSGTFAEVRAQKEKIPVTKVIRKEFESLHDYDMCLIDSLKDDNIDLIVLAGFLSFIGPDFINEYKNRIINVHPSLIPAFCGDKMYGIKPHIAAIERGVKVTGATVHFVDEEYDTGPIILQKAVIVEDKDTPLDLQERVMREAEQVILPQAILLFSQGRIKITGRKIQITK